MSYLHASDLPVKIHKCLFALHVKLDKKEKKTYFTVNFIKILSKKFLSFLLTYFFIIILIKFCFVIICIFLCVKYKPFHLILAMGILQAYVRIILINLTFLTNCNTYKI